MVAAPRPPQTLSRGDRATLPIAITNEGNVPARGSVPVAVTAGETGGSAGASLTVAKPVHLALKPGQTKTVNVLATLPANLAAGSYLLTAVLRASALGGAAQGDDTLTASAPVQVG